MGYLYSVDVVFYTFCIGLYQSDLLFLRVLYLLVVKLLKQHPSCYPEGGHIWLAVDLSLVNDIIHGDLFIIVFFQETCSL